MSSRLRDSSLQLFRESQELYPSSHHSLTHVMSTLTPSEFSAAAKAFLKWSDDNLEGWKTLNVDNDDSNGKEDPLTTVLANRFHKKGLCLDVHLVYDVSYQVPSTLLQLSTRQGRSLLDAEEVLDVLGISPRELKVSVSQVMHPLQRLPVWKVHPCNTKNVVDTVRNSLGEGAVREDNFLRLYWSLYRKVLGV